MRAARSAAAMAGPLSSRMRAVSSATCAAAAAAFFSSACASGAPERAALLSMSLPKRSGRRKASAPSSKSSRPEASRLSASSMRSWSRRHFRSGLLAPYVDPVLPTKSHRAHRVLRQVVAQFQLGILQEARELPPERECVVRRLAQGAGRQGSVAGCLDLHADYLQQWLGPLQTQRMARGVVEVLFARQGVEPEQLVDPRHDARGDHVVRMELGRLEKLPSRMRPASGMHDPRSADAIIGAITVGLQNAFELPQKLLWPVAPPPQTEVEHYAASRPAVLPQIRLMVLPPPIVHLHIYRRLIGLNVTAAD